MASTTTNLGLTKPAYSDDADISDINGNMDLIDAEAGKVRANVAANYDSSETYTVGDYCLHDGSLYKCSTAISSPEAWTAGHWTQIKITGELSALNGNTVPNRKTITLNNSRDVAFGVLTANSNLRLWIPHQINLSDGSSGSVTSASITYVEAYVNGSDVVLIQSVTGLNNGSYSAYGIVMNIAGSYGSLGIPLNTPMICPVKGTIVLE